MSQNIKGTFASGASSNAGQLSDTLVIPTNETSAVLNLSGAIDASNTVKTQKTTDNGLTWADVATYNSAQADTAVTVAHGEQWRLLSLAAQAYKSINYSFSAES